MTIYYRRHHRLLSEYTTIVPLLTATAPLFRVTMVLSDADGAKSRNAFEDTAPQSDSDHYADSGRRESPQTYDIDGTSLPRPFPGSGILGYNDANLSKLVHARMDQARKVLKRSPTTDEATALAYWTAKQMSILSYGTPVGVASGLWRAYSTAPSFRFPFFKPDLGKFNPSVFPSPRYSLATGLKAMASWHSMRILAYGTVGNFVGTVLFASYSMSVVSIGEITDTRLKDYISALREFAQKTHGALPNPQREPATAGTPTGPTGQATEDDASPTNGTYWGLNDNPSDKGWTNGNDPRESQSPPSRSVIGAPRRDNPPAPTVDEPSYQTADFDDASPTGGRGVTDDMASTESAWERIRRQGTSPGERGQSPTVATGQSAWSKGPLTSEGSSTSGEGPGSFGSQNGRMSAREAAQREFDERLERERQGEHFDGGK